MHMMYCHTCAEASVTLLFVLIKMWGSSKLCLADSMALDAMGHLHGVDPESSRSKRFARDQRLRLRRLPETTAIVLWSGVP